MSTYFLRKLNWEPINTKLQFTSRPEYGSLSAFLNKYKILSFKRLETKAHLFAAEVENISAFDAMCAAKEIMCGGATVTVTPCYKITKCPDNVKSDYIIERNTNETDGKKDTDSTEEVENALEVNVPPKTKTATEKQKVEIEKKTDVVATEPKAKNTAASKDATLANNESKPVPNKATPTPKANNAPSRVDIPVASNVATKADNVEVKTKPASEKPTSALNTNITPTQQVKADNPVASKDATKADNTDNAVTTPVSDKTPTKATPAPNNQTASAKQTPAKQTPPDKQTPAKQTPPAKQAPAKQTPPAKEAPAKQTPPAKQAPAKQTAPAQATNAKQAAITKPTQNAKQSVNAKKNATKPAPKAVRKPIDEDEELDDEEILKLISGGIVLDECIGSDED